MNQRTGWVLVAVGAGVCVLVWCAYAWTLHLYVIEAGRRMFD